MGEKKFGWLGPLVVVVVSCLVGFALMQFNFRLHQQTLAKSERLFEHAGQCRVHFGKQKRLSCNEAAAAADRQHWATTQRHTSLEACEDVTGTACISHPTAGPPTLFVPRLDGFVVGRELDSQGTRAVFAVYRVDRPATTCSPENAQCSAPTPALRHRAKHLKPGYYTHGVLVGDLTPDAKITRGSRSGTAFVVSTQGELAITTGTAIPVDFGKIHW